MSGVFKSLWLEQDMAMGIFSEIQQGLWLYVSTKWIKNAYQVLF